MISQEKIAKEIGISQGHLSRFLSGESRGNPTAKTIAKIVGLDWWEVSMIDGDVLRDKLEAAIEG